MLLFMQSNLFLRFLPEFLILILKIKIVRFSDEFLRSERIEPTNMLEQAKQRNRRIIFISWIAGTLFVIASLTVCIIVNAQINDFLLNAEKCTAIVSDIKEGMYEEKDGSELSYYRKGIYTGYVDYVVDGVKYNNVNAGNISSSANIGDKVEIYYNKSNPKNIKLSDNITSINGAVFLLVLALIVGIVGLVVMGVKFKKSKMSYSSSLYKN